MQIFFHGKKDSGILYCGLLNISNIFCIRGVCCYIEALGDRQFIGTEGLKNREN